MPQEEQGSPGGNDGGNKAATKIEFAAAPSISLPKGGGAIRGMGEKFAMNPVTGTGSLSVPIYASPGRAGFGPQLSLSYDSGAGNGPFGLGWNLSLPAITRKTDKGLPQYRDAEESDVFILSGAEDLVPVLNEDGTRYKDDVSAPGYVIHRYRPRVEGLFARIERWTGQDGEVHWRSISKDNITTWYGKTNKSRIAEPNDDDRGRIFSWLISESYDDKGNAMVYEYKEEDSESVSTGVHERNRSPESRKANRYLKSVKYGNLTSRLVEADLSKTKWMFQVVFDYGEYDPEDPKPDDADAGKWLCRHDPFSSYRAGFEVRTYRLCQRILMFHHFSGVADVGQDCLVRSTDFVYRNTRDNPEDLKSGNPIASFIASITQNGYKRKAGGGYTKRSLPPLQFEYSEAKLGETVEELNRASLENLPEGVDGGRYQFVDLDGEGLAGILTEQAGAWFYKPNRGPEGFGPLQLVAAKPSTASLHGGQQLLDLAGDGQLDLVDFSGAPAGFYERNTEQGWEPFTPFASLPNLDWRDPNLKFADLTGDGHADLLITEHEVLAWHPSLAEAGFGPALRVPKPLDEEEGPKLVFADGTQSVYLADLSGDGLTDLVRIRNGEVCYWPNLGYGRFGRKVTMDNSPWFDAPDLFDQRRLRLADIDGSGTTDLIYLDGDGIKVYFNQSGNGWSAARTLPCFPRIDSPSSVQAADLLGDGTACLVWSSPLPGDTRRPLRYVRLMAEGKPHLLTRIVNNLGAETRLAYAPSTKFYLDDKKAGKPWQTRLPFPVHAVERVETYDWVSGNRFVNLYAYHHGYFDGAEREFRGFGMVEQWDTEEYDVLKQSDAFPVGTNIDPISHVPPVWTKTWFHTGAFLEGERLERYYCDNEYYRGDPQAYKLPDTVYPTGLTPPLTAEEERELCRAMKGSILRQEIRAQDKTPHQEDPYKVSERNYAVERLQPRAGNRHAVFFTHPLETIDYQYERDPSDPRITHQFVLQVDAYGNVLKSAAVGYGRRGVDDDLSGIDQGIQRHPLLTYTENDFAEALDDPNTHLAPLPIETWTYELTGFLPSENNDYYEADNFVIMKDDKLILDFENDLGYGEPLAGGRERRLIEQVRTLYYNEDLSGPLPLPPKKVVTPALPYEQYYLAFTPNLLKQILKRNGADLLPDPPDLLQTEGGYLRGDDYRQGGDPLFPLGDPLGQWWIPTGQQFYSPIPRNPAPQDPPTPLAQDADYARQNFYLPQGVRDPFGALTRVTYDDYNLLPTGSEDELRNSITTENDYRVLQPRAVLDPNLNRIEAVFDALGMVAGTTVMGKYDTATKRSESGDTLKDFSADLSDTDKQDFLTDPNAEAGGLLKKATTRIIYDLDRYRRAGQPVYAATLAREIHTGFPGGDESPIQVSLLYSDGFGREAQTKIQAEPGEAPQREAPVDQDIPGALIFENGELKREWTDPRWVGTGRTVYNNKGKPVKKYEPFFSSTHLYEAEPEMAETGVTPVLFYDPVERVIATLHPNHTYEKVVFDPWRQATYDVNDTVGRIDQETGDFIENEPHADPDIQGYVEEYFKTQPADWQTWYQARQARADPAEQDAARKTEVHADTPAVAYFDALGRPFLTAAHNREERKDSNNSPYRIEGKYFTRVVLDIEGNQREVLDEIRPNGIGRLVMRYGYSMLGIQAHQKSMEAGERWALNDAVGKPIRAWDSRGHVFETEYDRLRRPLNQYVTGGGPDAGSDKRLTDRTLIERIEYGEGRADAAEKNLRTRAYQQFDGAGIVTNEAYDFKGNLLRTGREVLSNCKILPDWSRAQATDAPLIASTAYDALNRPIRLVAPHAGSVIDVIQPIYNEANLLNKVDTWLHRQGEPGPHELLDPATADLHAVTNIDYNAKGQRMLIEYGNGTRTAYDYDPQTFRLISLLTTRGRHLNLACEPTLNPRTCADPPDICPGQQNKKCVLQDLHYTYDPAGNITFIRDDAQQVIFFRNKRVEPSAEYAYDAIYRLILASGREHLGLNVDVPYPPTPPDCFNTFHTNPPDARDGKAMGRYEEEYVYDEAGNFDRVEHRGTDPQARGWTRAYFYKDEESRLSDGNYNNRLTQTIVQGQDELYKYDKHGNMRRMSCYMNYQDKDQSNVYWDYKDRLIQVDLGGGGTAYYTYDAGGQRVRKLWEKGPGLVEERIYLGIFEIFRRRDGQDLLVRETLHIMDDKQRIVLVETKIDPADPAVAEERLMRYQFGNHLGSVCLELDDQARIISYEEYYPYGGTSYQAVRKDNQVPVKRYRYTGKERDEETGLDYYGARYYVGWLGRWVACDPVGLVDGRDLYGFCKGNPVVLRDYWGKQTEDNQENKVEDDTKEYVIHFAKGNADLDLGAKEIEELKRVMLQGNYDISGIEGYASQEGNLGLNIRLSQDRAEAVKEALKLDYDIETKGRGIENPVTEKQESEYERSLNRRVVVKLREKGMANIPDLSFGIPELSLDPMIEHFPGYIDLFPKEILRKTEEVPKKGENHIQPQTVPPGKLPSFKEMIQQQLKKFWFDSNFTFRPPYKWAPGVKIDPQKKQLKLEFKDIQLELKLDKGFMFTIYGQF